MIVQDVLELLQQKTPVSLAEEWDNVGLLIGDEKGDVDTAVIALDVTDAVIDHAVAQGAQLIITHHPVIFEPLKTLPADCIAHRLIKAGIAVISMHTNADKAFGGVNDCLCERLGLSNVSVAPDGLSRIGTLPASMSATVFAEYVAHCLGTAVRVKTGADEIRTVVVCGGAGADLVIPLLDRADAAVTGEVKHHEWLSVSAAKTLVDGGHYATENAVIDRFFEWVHDAFPALNMIVYTGEAPYVTIEV